MKIRALAYLIFVTGILSFSCRNKNNDIEEQRYTWSTDAPMTMPYRVRIQRFERENLVRNHSFETGRTFRLDSLRTSFAIDGWQLIGDDLQWTDILNDSLYSPDEAYSGKRAIKIIRNKAFETDDQGEGILSDFIRVIPGNYSLSLYAKMKEIFPSKSRLGTKMYDGIDIRVLFFDRNKNQMDAGTPFHQENQEIDASFKSLSFAHYRSVKEFGWGKVIGKSHSYPFPEGDIPSDAHYARIYLGLKGTGTLWIDSVTFKYTDFNFSISERMLNYTDTAYNTACAIIPSPKAVIRLQSLAYFKNNMPARQLPVMVVDENLNDDGIRAVEIIRNALQKKIAEFSRNTINQIEIKHILDEGRMNDSRLVISIGKTNLYSKYSKFLPIDDIKDKPQGYYIYTPSDQENVVLLDAGNGTGLYYAALTLIQLLDKKVPVFHNCRIIDYPDFPGRYYTMESRQDVPANAEIQMAFAQELMKYKINGAVILDKESQALSDNPKIDNFKLVSAGGYSPPANTSSTYQYPLLISNQESSNSDFIIPPVFHNQMLDNSNYEEGCRYQEFNSKSFVYSGSAFFSLNTDAADIARYAAVMGNKPVFMDNSMRITESWERFGKSRYYYPGKLRLYNLFEPFVNEDIKEFFHDFDTAYFIINLPVTSEIEIIRLATAAEFMWNASDYNHDYALWKVLVSRYGVENARDLITYAEKYSILLEIMLRMEMNIQAARNLKEGQQVIVELTGLLGDISVRTGSQNSLVKELQKINSALRTRINQKASLVINLKK